MIELIQIYVVKVKVYKKKHETLCVCWPNETWHSFSTLDRYTLTVVLRNLDTSKYCIQYIKDLETRLYKSSYVYKDLP